MGEVSGSLLALTKNVAELKSRVDQFGDVNASFQTITKSVDELKSRVDQFGDVNASFQTLTKTVESTKSRVDELMAWKNRILGGAVVVGVLSTFVLALLGVGFKTFYDTVRAPPSAPATSAQPATVPR